MSTLPTKKQKELLDFITSFIGEYGYSPSYREIKAALSYSSIATVAKHIANLSDKGLLVKRDRSARSLEPVADVQMPPQLRAKSPGNAEKWLIDTIDAKFRMVEANPRRQARDIDHLTVLVASLKVLGLDGAFTAFSSRLQALEKS